MTSNDIKSAEHKKSDNFIAGPIQFKSQNVKLPVKKFFNQDPIPVVRTNDPCALKN